MCAQGGRLVAQMPSFGGLSIKTIDEAESVVFVRRTHSPRLPSYVIRRSRIRRPTNHRTIARRWNISWLPPRCGVTPCPHVALSILYAGTRRSFGSSKRLHARTRHQEQTAVPQSVPSDQSRCDPSVSQPKPRTNLERFPRIARVLR